MMKSIEDLKNERTNLIIERNNKILQGKAIYRNYLAPVRNGRRTEAKIYTDARGVRRTSPKIPIEFVCEDKNIRMEQRAIYNKLTNEIIEDNNKINSYSDVIKEAERNEILGIAPSQEIQKNENIFSSNVSSDTDSLEALIEKHKNRIKGKYTKEFDAGYEQLLKENSPKDFPKTNIEVMIDALKRFGLFDYQRSESAKDQAISAIKMHRIRKNPKTKKNKLVS